MPGLRNHEPIVIERFGGLWQRGDAESAPSDHFTTAQNIQFFDSGFETRNPLDVYMATALGPITRVYDYVTVSGQSLLVHYVGGVIFHIVNGVATQILSIPGMEDFGFVAIGGRAFITPFKSYTDAQGMFYELGLQNQFVYVYDGNPAHVPARKAGGFPPTNGGQKAFLAYPSIEVGKINEGIHSIVVSFRDSTASIGNPGPASVNISPLADNFRIVNSPFGKQIQLNNIPIGPSGILRREIQMSVPTIPPETFNPDPLVYTYYRVLIIPNNTETSALINVTDAEVLADSTKYPPYGGGPIASPITTALWVTNTKIEGFSDLGFHLVGVVYETDTGYLTAPGPEFKGGQTYVNTKTSIRVSNIPIGPSYVKKRHLISTKRIDSYNGDQNGYQYFFIPEGNIDDNTTTEKVVKYYDADLLDDASHLIDNFSEIPAGVSLNTYHSRLVVVGEYGTTESLTGIQPPQVDNRSIARISAPGEPEAISKVDGLIIAPLDGNPLTNCQEFRDVLYLFKKTRTYGYSDNEDVPSSWREQVIDQGVGAHAHGIAAVLDSGGVNIDFLLIADLSGLMIFNGVYARPELSWKIEDYWRSLNRNEFRSLQIVNDSLNKKIWIALPPPARNTILHANYGDGLDAKNIKWSKWYFDQLINGTALIDTDKLILTSIDGVYYINPTKSGFWDTYYTGAKKIPDPTVVTALFGE